MKPNTIGAGIGSGIEKAMMAQQLMASNASIAHTKAQEDLTRQQIANAKVDGAMKAHDLAIARRDNMSSNPSQAGKMFRDIYSVSEGFIDSLKTDMQQGSVESVNDYYKNMIEGARKKHEEKDLLDRAKRAKNSK